MKKTIMILPIMLLLVGCAGDKERAPNISTLYETGGTPSYVGSTGGAAGLPISLEGGTAGTGELFGGTSGVGAEPSKGGVGVAGGVSMGGSTGGNETGGVQDTGGAPPGGVVVTPGGASGGPPGGFGGLEDGSGGIGGAGGEPVECPVGGAGGVVVEVDGSYNCNSKSPDSDLDECWDAVYPCLHEGEWFEKGDGSGFWTYCVCA